jgi:hypothetical protein
MLYVWKSNKVHHHPQNVLGTGRDKDKVVSLVMAEIKRGDVFEPTAGELRCFADCMEPVGESLRVHTERESAVTTATTEDA